jgi:uncharacterized membrane protein
MTMFKLIGADQKEYGPVTLEQLQRWMAEGRVNAHTLVQPLGATEWKPLSSLPEFAGGFGAPAVAAVPTSPPFPQTELAADILARDYEFDIGSCINNGWELLRNNFGMVFGGVAIYLLIEFGLSALGQIPLIGILAGLANFIIAGPLTGGVYYFLLRIIRRQKVEIGDVFGGFRVFPQLLLVYVVCAVLAGVAALPGLVIMAFPIFSMIQHHAANPISVLCALGGFLVVFIPLTFLLVSWIFALPLAIDKELQFWPAMELSRKQVGRHWWLVFGLLVVTGLLNFVGFLVCCVGMFITAPIGLGAIMYAYETLFPPPAGTAA